MKKHIQSIGAAVLMLSVVLTGCDKVEGPYSEGPANNNTDTTVVVRNVLLEDYTGHKCQGCPAAHEEANNLKAALGKRLIVMTIHAGFWANTNATGSFTYDFETQTSLDLYGALIPSTQPFPTGDVDRRMNGTTRVVDYPDWGSKVNERLQDAVQAGIKITPEYNTSTREIKVDIEATFLDNLTGDYDIAVYYTEDSIINWQAFPVPLPNDPNYVHRHVLRGAVTSSFGALLATNPSIGTKVNKSFTSTPIQADINTDHVSIVAVITNATTKEVIQAQEVELLP